jgi:DHHC palmitoyltransferase
VGIGNHKYFLLFVFYTFLSCCYSLTLIIARFSFCGISPVGSRRHPKAIATLVAATVRRPPPCLDHPSQLLTILFLLIEAILFGIFTSCMMFDQADVIRSKVTHIDRLTGSDVSGNLAGVLEVFGVLPPRSDNNNHNDSELFLLSNKNDTSIRMDWFSPFARVCLPSREEVMGFCRPCRIGNNNVNRTTSSSMDNSQRSNKTKIDKLEDIL